MRHDHPLAGQLPIGDVARRTGVAVPTLRAWQQRYGVLRPIRTAGGHRRYSEADVRRVLAVRDLVADGWTVKAAAGQVISEAGDQPAEDGIERLRERLIHAVDEALQEVSAEALQAPAEEAAADEAGLAAASGGTRRSGRGAGTAAVGRARPSVTTPVGQLDNEVLTIVHQATRALLHIRNAQEAVDIVTGVATRLGARIVPANTADDSALPIDLSFGEGEPILPAADPLSVARLRLEEVLPGLVEDARRAVQLARALEP
jgi:DNA-binding transcriptional MerR regulator